MALEALGALGGAAQSGGSGLQSITGALGDIFGTSSSVSGSGNSSGSSSGESRIIGTANEQGTKKAKGRSSERLQIDNVGIQKLLQDMLGSQQGLASIFSNEKVSGLYGSTAATQASGNLLANLAGEIAKLTAKKVSETDEEEASGTTQNTRQNTSQSAIQNASTTSNQESGSDGLLGQIGGIFGF